MKTFKEIRSRVKVCEEYFIEDLDTSFLYDILSEKEINEYNKILAILELYNREEIDLTEDEYMDLFEAIALPAPSGKELVTSPSNTSVGAAKSPINTSKFPTSRFAPRATIKDVAMSALRAGGRLATKAAPQATALGVGLGAGEVVRKGLNKLGSDDNSTGNISKLNKSSPGDGVKFKGDVPTIPTDKKYTEPKTKISQPELGSMLRNEPKALELPKPEMKNIGPTSGSSAKPATVIQKPKIQNTPKPSTKAGVDPDLMASVQKMRSATQDMVQKTGAMKSAFQKMAPSSSNIHTDIAKLGGEPTSPPKLSSSEVKKNSSGPGKWM